MVAWRVTRLQLPSEYDFEGYREEGLMNGRFLAIVPLGPGTRVRPRSGCTLETIALAGDV